VTLLKFKIMKRGKSHHHIEKTSIPAVHSCGIPVTRVKCQLLALPSVKQKTDLSCGHSDLLAILTNGHIGLHEVSS